MASRFIRGRQAAAPVVISLLVLTGCTQQTESGATQTVDQPVTGQSVTAEDVLTRCAAAYTRARTFHIIGVLKDYRPGKNRTVPISWEFERPGRCKLQIGMDAALVLGDDCWIYTSERGRYTKQRRFSRTPMQTTAFLLSDGVALLLPELCTGARIFEAPQVYGWRIDGTDWSGGHPCYVLTMVQAESETPRNLLLWIDQDSFLIREWAIVSPGPNGTERALVECDFTDIDVNIALSEEAFSLNTPTRIEIAAKNPAGKGI